MFEDMQGVTRVNEDFISVNGWVVRATPEQEARVRALTIEQRQKLLLLLATV